jgi:hypothetical protein
LIKEDNNNFTILFDGKSLDDWKMIGEGNFIVIESEKALLSQGGMGLLWNTKKKYNDFMLKLEWRVLHKDDNSGVFVRFPDPGNDPRVAVNIGYEIQIDDLGKPDGDGIHKTEIKVIKQNYTVMINHQKVVEFIGNRSLSGYVGLQNHDAKSKVSFRNIRIKEMI